MCSVQYFVWLSVANILEEHIQSSSFLVQVFFTKIYTQKKIYHTVISSTIILHQYFGTGTFFTAPISGYWQKKSTKFIKKN